MADLYVRIDDRLIHGQTIVAWCPTLQIKEIVAVDDVSAKNPMLKTIMTMGVPSTYKTHIVTTQEAKEILKTPGNGNRLMKLDGATGIFYLSDQDVEILDGFADQGLEVFFHQLPTSARTTWAAFKKTI